MGSGSFSSVSYSTRAEDRGYASKSVTAVFTQRNINNAMDPYGIKIRESRDSAEHPNSVPIIIALDVTGSMGSIPHHLVKNGLVAIMDSIMTAGISDPQILFLAVGDHECDHAPLQVGQFETSDELLEKWLTSVFMEGGGGANAGESYSLAWYFAANHTSIDSFEKRGKKGYLFTIGDEPTLMTIPKNVIKNIMGCDVQADYTASGLLETASKMYHTYHIHVKETRAGMVQSTIDGWAQLIADGLCVVDAKEDIPKVIADKIVSGETVKKTSVNVGIVSTPSDKIDVEMML